MAGKSELKKSVRDTVLYANPVKGATPRAYETHPCPASKDAQKFRGQQNFSKVKAGKIPKPKSFKL